MRRPVTILEIGHKATFFEKINKPIIFKFFKDFTNYRKTGWWLLALDLPLIFPNTGITY